MMKKVKNPMFVIRLLLGLCLFSCVSLNLSQAQVHTRVLNQTQAVSDVIPWYFENLISYHDQPIVDFEQVLAEDKKKGQIMERIAVKLTTNYSEADGVWYELDDFMVWQLGIRATHAASLSFVCSHLQLPADAQMYIYGSNSKTVIGPIEASHIYEGSYATDLVGGNESVLMVLVKKDAAKLFKIQIESISQGVSRSSNNQDDRFGRAEDCNFDVNCPIGSDWKNERDATAFLYIDGAFNCTGALINNACQDLTPHFLTAFHCLDINGVGGFDEDDRAKIKNCVFRFHYQTNEPMCPGNSRGDQGDWLTFTGSTLLATFRPADAALFKLNGTISGQKGLALMGWDRSSNAASSGVCIHHPRGDAKKISTFDEPAERRDNFKFPNAFPPPGNQHWLVARWSQGITEKGSSGAPLINEDHRLVGLLSAGESNCKTSGLGDIFGRFDNAWTGGGTDETRLSTWLGGRNVQETVNTLQVPWVNTEGSDAICTINKTISLANPIVGKQISWSVAPITLFANSAGATTAGIGTDVVLRAANATSQGQAILTYLLSENGCEPVTIEKRLWVGTPSLPLTIPSGSVPISLPVGQFQSVRLISSGGAERLVANWSASGAVSVVPVPVATEQGRFKGNYTGLGHWRVATSNTCGVSSNNYGRFNVSGIVRLAPESL